MPAVQLSRLKTQLDELTWKFSRPEDFRRAVNDLFEQYGDHSYRAGQMAPAARGMPAYRVPVIVLRRLEQELTRHIQENPDAALAAADALWKDTHLEPRLVAAYLLGQAPVEPPQPVIERLKDWCHPRLERQALQVLLVHGCTRLRKEAPQAWFQLLQEWLETYRTEYEGMALKAILPAVQDRKFENLPSIFQCISSLVRLAPAGLQNELDAAIEALARRSPIETAHFLRQALSMGAGPNTLRLVRRALPAFPEALQEGLRSAIKNA